VQLLSLVVGIIVSLWISQPGQFSGDAAVTPTPAERPAPAMAADEITPDGAGRDDGPQIGPALPAPAPYLVYLVRDDQQQRAMGGSAPTDGVATLVAGAPEALAAALAQVRLLEANLAIGQSARAVQVIDGRE